MLYISRIVSHGRKKIEQTLSKKEKLTYLTPSKNVKIIAIIAALLFFIYAIVIIPSIGLATYVGGNVLWLQSAKDVKKSIQKYIQNTEENIIVFEETLTGYQKSIPARYLGVHFDTTGIDEQIESLHGKNIIQKTFLPQRLEIHTTIDDLALVERLQQQIEVLKNVKQEPTVQLKENNTFEVVEGKNGNSFDIEKISSEIINRVVNNSNKPIIIEVYEASPTLSKEEGEKAKQYADWLSNEILIIQHGNQKWDIPLDQKKDWLEFYPQDGFIDSQLNEEKLEEYLKEYISPEIDIHRTDIEIQYDEMNQPIVNGTGKNGVYLNTKKTTETILENIKNTQFLTEAIIDIDHAQVLQDKNPLGITELIAEGQSNFDGSPKNRVHNISVGAKKFENILVAPGSQFSFLDILGPVTKATGYLPELVIKKGGAETIKEYGGGLCQVSSTVYRAALSGGFKIDKRRNHSYFVTYYTPVGLDATIYDPIQDFIFTNDTEHHILIQNLVDTENNILTFRIWGTPDGREVRLDGPYSYAYTGMPQPEYILSDNLPAGEIKLEKNGHVGFQVDWYRYIKMPGETEETKEQFHSHYKAIPPVYSRGNEG